MWENLRKIVQSKLEIVFLNNSLKWSVEDSKQQFEEDSSCCRHVTENLMSYFTVVLGVKFVIVKGHSTQFLQ